MNEVLVLGFKTEDGRKAAQKLVKRYGGKFIVVKALHDEIGLLSYYKVTTPEDFLKAINNTPTHFRLYVSGNKVTSDCREAKEWLQ